MTASAIDENKPEHPVVDRDEHHDGEEAPDVGVEALVDVFRAHAGADGTLLDDLHRRCQRAGTQQQGDVGGLLRGFHAGDLHPAAADFLADDRRGDRLGAALLDQQDGHALADILARHVLEDACTLAVQVDVHGRLAAVVVEAGRGVGDRVAGQHHVLLHCDIAAVAAGYDVIAERRLSLRHGNRIGLFVDHADFQGGGAPQDVLGLGRVLHAGQLHHDAEAPCCWMTGSATPSSLTRFRKRGDVLLQGEFLHPGFGFRLEACSQGKAFGQVFGGEDQVGERGAQFVDRSIALIAGGEMHDHGIAFAADAAVADLVAAQFGAEIVLVADGRLFQGGLHVDFEQEVHAAAQIQAEIHRQRIDGREPRRRGRHQVQRHGVAVAEAVLQHILGLDLQIGAGKAYLDAVARQFHPAVGQLGRLQCGLHLPQQRRVDFLAGAQRRQLHCGHFTKEVGQGVEEGDHQRDADEHIFPEREAVHLLGARNLVRGKWGELGAKRLRGGRPLSH